LSSRNKRARQHREAAKARRVAPRKIKRNRKPDRVRERYWVVRGPVEPDALEGLEGPQQERVMPRGERERRRALEASLRKPEEAEAEPQGAEGAPEDGCRGTVVQVSTSLCRVDVNGRSLLCGLRGGLSASDTGLTNVVAVGDRVIVAEDGQGTGVVEAVLPRRTVLARPDVFYAHLQHVIAANVDQLLVVSSWREPAVWLELIDRCLVAAERNGLAPIICLNKIDLADELSICRAALRAYLALGYRVLFTSALSGAGIDELREALHDQTTALAGLSGVGKSSLLTAIQPDLQLRVSEVSDHWHLGRHTTSQVTLHRLEMGGYVVDTPGIREFGLSGLRRGELACFYPEIAALAPACRFADCCHVNEPGCAVIAGVSQGKVTPERYQSYRTICRELRG
jgi:ribosome biogenesis GTPase